MTDVPSSAAEHVAYSGIDGARLRIGDDVRLRDPMWIKPPERRPLATILGHSGYYEDPAYERIVGDLVGLPLSEIPGQRTPQPRE